MKLADKSYGQKFCSIPTRYKIYVVISRFCLAYILFQASRFKKLLDLAPVVLDYLEHIADCELPFGRFC